MDASLNKRISVSPRDSSLLPSSPSLRSWSPSIIWPHQPKFRKCVNRYTHWQTNTEGDRQRQTDRQRSIETGIDRWRQTETGGDRRRQRGGYRESL